MRDARFRGEPRLGATLNPPKHPPSAGNHQQESAVAEFLPRAPPLDAFPIAPSGGKT